MHPQAGIYPSGGVRVVLRGGDNDLLSLTEFINFQTGRQGKLPPGVVYSSNVCWNIYLGNVYIIYLSHPGERPGKLTTKM